MSTAPRKAKTKTQASAEATADTESNTLVRTIKKYPNRRLYDTRTSSYITLADVKAMVMGCEHFVVLDAKTGEDLTRSILLQIILEEETAGVPMFSTQVLAQIIRFYGHTMQGMMGHHLENNIQAFIDMQSKLTENSMMNLQNPLMQSFMGNYLEQSQKAFAQMQERMAQQAEVLMNQLGAGLSGKK